jgi:hypothetical protein
MRAEASFSKSAVARFARDILLSAVTAGVLIALGTIFDIVPFDILVAVGSTLVIALAVGLAVFRTHRGRLVGFGTGLVGIWRDEEHFERLQGISYREHCQRFIKGSVDGATIRIIGYDWIEIFQDTTLLANDIFGPDGTSRVRFDVVLVDPHSPVAVEKRAWEMLWKDASGDPLYPEGASDASMQRLASKIETCVTVARIFEQERPQYFRLKLTPTMIGMSAIMREDKATGVLYAAPWKGGDSIIFEVERVREGKVDRLASPRRRIYGADLYGFVEGYWDALWQDPHWRLVDLCWK